MARILAISSQVVRGHIGLSAIVPALQALGHEVWPLPTIMLSNHPGHTRAAGLRTPVDKLEAMLDALAANGWLGEIDAVLTGYLPSPEHVAFAAQAIARLKAVRADARVLVDPVLGDEPKGLYIDSLAAAAIRYTLVPFADVLTPNRFELGWLAGRKLTSIEDAEAAARALGRPTVVVTSAALLPSPLRGGGGGGGSIREPSVFLTPSLTAPRQGEGPHVEGVGNGQILTLLATPDTAVTFATPHRPHVAHGTGDLFSGLLLGHMLAQRPMPEAVARAVAGVARAIEASSGRDELMLAGALPAISAATPTLDHASSDWVAGVDGCPGGWLVVLRRLDDPATAHARLLPTFADVLALPEAPRIIAVDMPIGLPERSGIGGRICDVAARANLGQRQSAVFAVPSRVAVMEGDYRRACDAAFATSDPPRMVSKQAFNLFPKIREIDALMTPALQNRVFEVHPELAFWALNCERELDQPKKVKSRPHDVGLELRKGLLAAAGYDRAFLESRPFRSSEAGADDLLDAAVCSWTAVRLARGAARRFPADPSYDARGLRMEIWG